MIKNAEKTNLTRRMQNRRPVIFATRFPSPRPSPSGRGRIAGRLLDSRGACHRGKTGRRRSLSPRERAGARGNSAHEYPSVTNWNQQGGSLVKKGLNQSLLTPAPALLFAFVPLLLFMAGTSISSATEFKAAVARTDITPPLEYSLWGYSDRKGGATSVLDPLWARILVLDDGSNRVALVTLDLGRSFGPPFMDSVRQRVKKSAGVHQVFFMASHTHSGPIIDDKYPEGQIPPWEIEAQDKISKAIEEAAGQLVSARLGTGYGETLIGHNRRFVQPEGTVKMLWRNATKIPTHPVDPTVGIIRVDDASGKPMAILVNYSCHPVVFGPDNLRYSADYPGAMAKYVEEHFDKTPVCFFLQGAPGDINPYFDKTPLTEDADRLMKETGEQLGKEAFRVARGITTRAPERPSLKYSLDTMKFALRWDAEKVMPGLEKG